MTKILVTGAAGFVGFHFVRRLCASGGYEILGIDNLNDYYDVGLKQGRLKLLAECPAFRFQKLDLADDVGMAAMFAAFKPEIVVNLAAQAGVRYSLQNPKAYVDSNVTGFLNVLEGCRHHNVRHLVFASSSSVYGANRKLPFSESDNVDHPVSLYAATKKGGELMAHSYAHLYGVPCTGLRFFTVYGPWGRPDMAYFKFTDAVVAGKPIDIYNGGDMKRDFTYIDDIVESMERVLKLIPQSNLSYNYMNPDPSKSSGPYRIYNIGANSPEHLMDLVKVIEEGLGVEAKKNFLPMQPGDVYETFADTDALEAAVGFRPKTSLREGMKEFMAWYKDYYGVDRSRLKVSPAT